MWVEAGLRHVFQRDLPEYTVVKQGLRLPPTTMTLNPDLVFGAPATLAVADVKYKIATDDWKRPDIYQVVTFATAYRVDKTTATVMKSCAAGCTAKNGASRYSPRTKSPRPAAIASNTLIGPVSDSHTVKGRRDLMRPRLDYGESGHRVPMPPLQRFGALLQTE
jgi:hypothetical protein